MVGSCDHKKVSSLSRYHKPRRRTHRHEFWGASDVLLPLFECGSGVREIGYGNDKHTRQVLPNGLKLLSVYNVKGLLCVYTGVGWAGGLGAENLYSYVSPLYTKLFPRACELSAK